MSSNAPEDIRVFVLDFALNNAVAERGARGKAYARLRFRFWQCVGRSVRATLAAFVRSRGYLRADLGRWVKSCVRHRQRCKDLASTEGVELFLGKAFESDAEDDESDVAVFGSRAGIRK